VIFESWRVVDTLNRFWGPQERQSPFDSRIEETGVMKWATTQLVWLIPLVVKVAMPGDILAKDRAGGSRWCCYFGRDLFRGGGPPIRFGH